jgi:hypothetical protein
MFRRDVNTLRDMRFRHIQEPRLPGPNSQLYEQHSIHVTTSVNFARKYIACPSLLIPTHNLLLRHRTCVPEYRSRRSVFIRTSIRSTAPIFMFSSYQMHKMSVHKDALSILSTPHISNYVIHIDYFLLILRCCQYVDNYNDEIKDKTGRASSTHGV